MSTVLPNSQIGTTQQVVSSDLAGGVIVVPFIAEVAAGASGEIAMLQQSAVNITGIDEVFTYTASVEDAVKILNSFNIVDLGLDNNAVLGNDPSGAEVEVSRDDNDADNFHAVLMSALTDASSSNLFKVVGGDGSATQIVIPEQYLEIESYTDTIRHLKYDTIANLLTAEDLFSFQVVLDTSGGARNMVNAIDGETALATAYRKTLFTQISQDRIHKYLTPASLVGALDEQLPTLEGVSTLRFLPLQKGDTMVFVFDATVGTAEDTDTGLTPDSTAMPTQGAHLTRVTVDALPAAGIENVNNAAGITTLSTTSDYASGGVTLLAPTKRRFAIRVVLAGDGIEESSTGKGFLVKDLSNGNAVFNPESADYPYMIAAGLIADSHEIELVATGEQTSLPGNVTSVTAETVTPKWADISGLDPSGGWEDPSGYVEVEVLASSSLTLTVEGNYVGNYMVVNDVNNVNRFVFDGSAVVYRARANQAANTDSAIVYYVTNAGKVEVATVSAGAGLGPSA